MGTMKLLKFCMLILDKLKIFTINYKLFSSDEYHWISQINEQNVFDGEWEFL
jgi:hypothetical protein